MTIETGATEDDIPALREALLAGCSPRDRIEHVYIEVHPGTIEVVLYLLATEPATAETCAAQLTCRAMADWSNGRPWRLRYCKATTIGGTADLP